MKPGQSEAQELEQQLRFLKVAVILPLSISLIISIAVYLIKLM